MLNMSFCQLAFPSRFNFTSGQNCKKLPVSSLSEKKNTWNATQCVTEFKKSLSLGSKNVKFIDKVAKLGTMSIYDTCRITMCAKRG